MTKKENPINRLVYYHSIDFDGISSAAIIREKYPDATFIGYDYGQPLELPEVNVPVIMVDVSLPMHSMRNLGIEADGFLWIDHHKTAIDDYNNNYVTGRELEPLIKPVHWVGKAACEITWEYFFPEQPVPHAIKLLGRYDVWDMSDLHLWENRILPFQYGMRAVCNNLGTFPRGLLNNDSATIHRIDEIIEIGESIMHYQEMQNEKMAQSIAFEAIWKGFKVILMNVGGANSKMFDSVYDPKKHELMMPFVFTGKHWKVSIYSTHDHIDCGDIARSMGGGGHHSAAGFQVDDLFLDLQLQFRK